MPAHPAPARRSGAAARVARAEQPGLRERKKERTRRELREGAARLFAARGFAGTTVADIAAAANVSERTFFRYFDGKEALLLPEGGELSARIEAELAARHQDEDPLAAVCAALLAAARPLPAAGPGAPACAPGGTDAPASARLAREFGDAEDRLAALVERRLPPGTPERDLHAAVLACAALSAVRAVLRTQRGRAGPGRPDRTGADLLPAALGMLSRLGSTAR